MRAAYRGHSTETGGELELPLGYVAWVRDGKLRTLDLFEPDDTAAMQARFAELRGLTLLGDRPVERVIRAVGECFGRHDRAAHEEICGRRTPRWSTTGSSAGRRCAGASR